MKNMLSLLSALALATSLPAAEFHAAPNGTDVNPGTAERPFATLERARDAVREFKTANGGTLKEPVKVILHGGEYALSRTFELTPQDSGTKNAPVCYLAAKGETPVITSARAIAGWKKLNPNIWVADVPKSWRFHFLYMDGQPQPVARLSKTDDWRKWSTAVKVGPVEPAGQLLTLPAGQLAGLPNNGDVEMDLMPMQYWNSLSVLRDIAPANNTCRRHSKNPTTCWRDHFGQGEGQYNLQNALQFLTQPGEWCVDSAGGKVYFWPPKGSPFDHQIWAPGLCRLIEFTGSDSNRVHDVEFRGLTFTCTERLPEDQWPDEWVKRQAELPDAMVFLSGVENCVLDRCRFLYSGSYCVALQDYAQGVAVTGNELGYPGCGGVLLQGYGPGTTDVNKNNVIRLNYIHHTGNGGYRHSAAVTLYQSGDNDIALNWIDRVPYAGIQIAGAAWDEFGTGKPAGAWDSYGNLEAMYQVRWNELPGGREGKFTREAFKTYLHSRNNRVRNNILSDYMAAMSDGGALYSWGCGTGNLWEGNLLRRQQTHTGEQLCLALYMDDHVDGATLINNVCWHAGSGSLNKGANKWVDNVIQPAKPSAYDQRLVEIAAESAKEGGWLAIPADAELPELAILGAERFVGSARVSIITRLDGVLHYTLDSSAPMVDSPVYLGPFTVTNTRPVCACVTDKAGASLGSMVRKTFTRLESRPLPAGEFVKATDVFELNGPRFDEKHENIGWCAGGGSLVFGPYRFAPAAIKGLEVTVGVDPNYAGQKMHVRLDAADGPSVGTFVLQSTGGFEVFKPQRIPLKDIGGEHLLYFVFDGRAGICNFKQFRFTTAGDL